MNDIEILAQIKDEYEQWFNYVQPKRQQFRERLKKRNNRWDDKISINLIANNIDVVIASRFTNAPKTKFISREWWIGQEEADNFTTVYEFDNRELNMWQVYYQKDQDILFFWVGILVDDWRDEARLMPKYRVVNPLSWIPDPIPTQTGRFDSQQYRWHWFNMITNINNLREKWDYDEVQVNKWIAQKFDNSSQQDRETYASAGNLNYAWTVESHNKNFVLDVYHHYTTIDWEKRLFVTDIDFTTIFKGKQLDAVLREEKLDKWLVPRPVMIEYYDPERWNPFGKSVPDLIEDKQNAINILYNLNIIKAKKIAMWWDYLVNSRLIKKWQLEQRSTAWKRYIYVDSFDADEKPLVNAMMQLPQDQTNPDTWTAVNALKQEAVSDTKIDQMQMWIVADKSMTKAEQQATQANANLLLSVKNNISGRFYKELAFQWWRSYQKNFKWAQKKFALLPSSFEWKWLEFKRDEFLSSQIPYILVWSKDDIEAKNTKLKQELLTLYPLVLNDPDVMPISKKIMSRMNMRLSWFTNDVIYSIYPMDADERMAKQYLEIINMWELPKSLFARAEAWPNFYLTVWLYLQKADESDNKDKVLWLLQEYMIQQNIQQNMMMQDNTLANSAANINMAQGAQQQWQWLIARNQPQEEFTQ